MKNFKIVLFDLDGVLINSKKNMKISWNEVCKKFKLDIPFEKYFELIGKDFKEILKDLKIKKNYEEIQDCFKKNSIKNFNLIQLYPKVKKILSILKRKKIKIGIVTSKDCLRSRKVLRKFSIFPDIIECSDGKLPGKPNPDKILKILKKFKIKKANAVYIGDMKVDHSTAKNAGVQYIHSNYGYSKKSIKCKYKINSIADLLELN